MRSAGFLLLSPVPRPPYVSADLVPDVVISASTCICPQFPGPYAIAWCNTPDDERAEQLFAAGVPRPLHADAIAWATEAFGSAYGWPGVFSTVDAARAARARFLAAADTVKVIGLGLPEPFAADFIVRATPLAAPPGYAPTGESGYLECVTRNEQLPPGGRTLGFELLNVHLGVLEDSWLCNGLERHCADAVNVRPSPNGLLGSLDDAIRCGAEIARDEVGAEPGPWYPFLLVEY